MWWQRKDIVIASQCEEATLSLMVEYDAEFIEGVENFKYLGRILDRYDKNWPAVFRNIGKARRVWNRLGKLLRGAEPRVSTVFY